MATLYQKLALALIGQALPDTPAFAAILHRMRTGLMMLIVTGVLVSATLLMGCFAFYRFLLAEGLSAGVGMALTAFLTACLAAICGLIAERHLNKTLEIPDQLGFFPKNKQSDLRDIAVAFVDGVFGQTGDTAKNNTNSAQKNPPQSSGFRNQNMSVPQNGAYDHKEYHQLNGRSNLNTSIAGENYQQSIRY